jgi:hypothetical protein
MEAEEEIQLVMEQLILVVELVVQMDLVVQELF